ncbi:MAG: hypothetical protein WDN45_01315 [Caulobacteraceae bacterium]
MVQTVPALNVRFETLPGSVKAAPCSVEGSTVTVARAGLAGSAVVTVSQTPLLAAAVTLSSAMATVPPVTAMLGPLELCSARFRIVADEAAPAMPLARSPPPPGPCAFSEPPVTVMAPPVSTAAA